jgi:hypothetical protein
VEVSRKLRKEDM